MSANLESSIERYHEYAGVRVVVLGATGFIGRWVARGLSASGANLFLPVRDLSAAKSIFEGYSVEGEIYELDLSNEQALRAMYRTVRPTITFNLSGYGIDREQQDELSAYRINVDLIQNLCSMISKTRDHTWPRTDIVHAGSAMEYGSTGGNLAEDSLPRPTSLYGRSKLSGTNILTKSCQAYRIKGLTARLFSVYGAGEPQWRLLPTLIRAAEDTTPIPLTAGMHKRDFVYVEDVAEGLLRLGLVTAIPGEVVNLATGRLSTVRSFVETAAEALDIDRKRLKFGALPTWVEEMVHEPVSVERMRFLTGRIPNTTNASGIRKSIIQDRRRLSASLNTASLYSNTEARR